MKSKLKSATMSLLADSTDIQQIAAIQLSSAMYYHRHGTFNIKSLNLAPFNDKPYTDAYVELLNSPTLIPSVLKSILSNQSINRYEELWTLIRQGLIMDKRWVMRSLDISFHSNEIVRFGSRNRAHSLSYSILLKNECRVALLSSGALSIVAWDMKKRYLQLTLTWTTKRSTAKFLAGGKTTTGALLLVDGDLTVFLLL